MKNFFNNYRVFTFIFLSLVCNLWSVNAHAAFYTEASIPVALPTPVSAEKTSETPVTSTSSGEQSSGYDWKHSGDIYDKYQWGFLGYIGGMTNHELNQELYFNVGDIGPGVLYTAEVSYQLSKDNWARKHIAPLLWASTIELATNVTYETDPTGPLWEWNNYFTFRWRDFPWNRTVLTTLGIGEGVSWASHVPQQEIDAEDEPGNSRKFLNYVMVEMTFSLPEHPEWQVMYRLQHRSGVFGLYAPGTVGSTSAGIGVRYWME